MRRHIRNGERGHGYHWFLGVLVILLVCSPVIAAGAASTLAALVWAPLPWWASVLIGVVLTALASWAWFALWGFL